MLKPEQWQFPIHLRQSLYEAATLEFSCMFCNTYAYQRINALPSRYTIFTCGGVRRIGSPVIRAVWARISQCKDSITYLEQLERCGLRSHRGEPAR